MSYIKKNSVENTSKSAITRIFFGILIQGPFFLFYQTIIKPKIHLTKTEFGKFNSKFSRQMFLIENVCLRLWLTCEFIGKLKKVIFIYCKQNYCIAFLLQFCDNFLDVRKTIQRLNLYYNSKLLNFFCFCQTRLL